MVWVRSVRDGSVKVVRNDITAMSMQKPGSSSEMCVAYR